MANFSSFHILFFVFFTGCIAVLATDFTIKNNCPETVWVGTLTNDNLPNLAEGGFELTQGASRQINAPQGWGGRFWARTRCNFDASGNGRCVTGDCGGLKCGNGRAGEAPVSLAEFKLQADGGKDFYDVSLVDGFNVKLGIRPSGGSGDNCRYTSCTSDVNAICPDELKVIDQNSPVACKSACVKFNTDQYCCRGAFDKPETCPPTDYSKIFENACPDAYSYAYDDKTSTFTCIGANYEITFCP